MDKDWLNVVRLPAAGQQGLSTHDWKQRTAEGRRQMKERYKYIMKEVDIACGNFIDGNQGEPQFMDVCCCPGGFSEYVLVANPRARGVGLSLNVELGGHIPSFDTYHSETGLAITCPLKEPLFRYCMKFVDVTTVCDRLYMRRLPPLNATTTATAPQDSLVILTDANHPDVQQLCNNCDLMILDGSFLGGKPHIYMESNYENDQQNPAFNVYHSHVAANQALLAAQLSIMARNAAAGAMVVLRMSMTWNHFTNGVLALLRRVFLGDIQNFKPRSCHQTAISYYLVCKDFNVHAADQLELGPRFAEFVQCLRDGHPAAEFVPFPELPEGPGEAQLYNMWGLALHVYHLPLWLFKKLSEYAASQPFVAQSGRAYSVKPCWRHLVFRNTMFGCPNPDGRCRDGAHSVCDLHPLATVAFAQVNAHMYMPLSDGKLTPGQGHPRDEEQFLVDVVANWYTDNFIRSSSGMAVSAGDPQQREMWKPSLHLQTAAMHKHIWDHIIKMAATEEMKLFRTIKPTANRLGPGGVTLGGQAASMYGPSMMWGGNTFSAARVLKGPVPDQFGNISSVASRLPDPQLAFTGLDLSRLTAQQQQGRAHAFGGGAGGAGRGVASGMGASRGASMSGAEQTVMLQPEQRASLTGIEPVGMAGKAGGAGAAPPGEMAMGGTEDEDTFGMEVFTKTTPISGYHMPFMEVIVADDGFSRRAMLDYLGG